MVILRFLHHSVAKVSSAPSELFLFVCRCLIVVLLGDGGWILLLHHVGDVLQTLNWNLELFWEYFCSWTANFCMWEEGVMAGIFDSAFLLMSLCRLIFHHII